MTYTVGGLIQATDYNGFVSTTSGANVNNVWGAGSGDSGWGQTSLSTVSSGGIVTAAQWAGLVNNLASMGSQTNTALTSRTAPVAGNVISILAHVNTDLTNVTTNRGNAAASGTTSSTWTGSISKTANVETAPDGWTLSWVETVTFANAANARYFWNAGGLVRLDMSKTSTGTDKDADWNTLVGQVGTIYFSGRVNSAAQTIAGVSYTGTTRIGGTGGTQTTLTTTTGWYSLTPGASATTIFQLNDATSPYTGDYIRVTAAINAGSTVLTLTTTWVDAGYSADGETNSITGGTDTTSPYSTFGTAPAVLCRFVPPSTTYLTNSWGTPAVAATAPLQADYLVVAGGGGGGSYFTAGGGGAGGLRAYTGLTLATATNYTVTVGAGGAGATSLSVLGSNGANSVFSTTTALGGGGGGSYGATSVGSPYNQDGQPGGSGGGGGAADGGSSQNRNGIGGTGSAGQGHAGGGGRGQNDITMIGGGGGGAGTFGKDGDVASGAGGDGIAYSISGSSVTYAGGGAGGGFGGAGTGGSGGGGNGGSGNGSTQGTGGTANRGGGGGGYGGNGTSNAGGSGTVIIKIPDTYTATFSGGVTQTSTSGGGFKIYTVTATSTTGETVSFS